MFLSPGQQTRFWREWSQVCRLRNWTGAEAETQRKLLLARASFTSLTLVDRKLGFDHVLMELAAILHPDDIELQMRLAEMPRIRLLHKITDTVRKISPSIVESAPLRCGYLFPIFMERGWKHMDVTLLSMEELQELLYTVSARTSSKRRKAREAAAVAAPVTVNQPLLMT